MIKRRIYLIAIIMLLLFSVLIAYRYQEDLKNKLYQEVFDEETVTMMVQESRNTLGLVRMIKKLLVEEKIRVDLQVIPDNQSDNIVRMKVNTGTVPDLLDCSIPSVYGLINAELYLEDLSNESWVSKLMDAERIMVNGKIYAFPLQETQGLAGIIYNKDIFEAYDLEIPKTEQELFEVCNILKSQNIDPILLCADKRIPQMWMNYTLPLVQQSDAQCAGVVEGIGAGEFQFSEYPEMAEVVDQYLELFARDYINENYVSMDYQGLIQALATGEGAMVMGNYTMMLDTIFVNNEVSLGMFEVPFARNTADKMVTPKEVKGFTIFKDSPNKETAKRVLELWSTPEYLDLWFMDTGGFPAFQEVDGGPIPDSLVEMYKEYMDNHDEIYELTSYTLPFYNIHTTKLWLYYMEAPENGDTGADVFAKYQLDLDLYNANKE